MGSHASTNLTMAAIKDLLSSCIGRIKCWNMEELKVPNSRRACKKESVNAVFLITKLKSKSSASIAFQAIMRILKQVIFCVCLSKTMHSMEAPLIAFNRSPSRYLIQAFLALVLPCRSFFLLLHDRGQNLISSLLKGCQAVKQTSQLIGQLIHNLQCYQTLLLVSRTQSLCSLPLLRDFLLCS